MGGRTVSKIFAAIMKFVVLLFVGLLVGCMASDKPLHGDWCAAECVHATNELALEHLEYMRAQNCRELELEKDERSAATIREIISGIDAHIDYIKSGR